MSPNEGQIGMPPELRLMDGGASRSVLLIKLPFPIGRAQESDLVLSQPFVSRQHAEIVRNGKTLLLRDTDSRHGTYVNGVRVSLHPLKSGDVLQFGSRGCPEVRFSNGSTQDAGADTTTQGLLGKLQAIQSDGTDLEKLRWFLQAARDLSSAGALDRVMASLLETTLALARVERGYVFLTDTHGELTLALGMDADGDVLVDASTVSNTVIRQAIEGDDQFLVTDTLTADGAFVPESIVAHSIRAVVCIPLRQRRNAQGGDTSQSVHAGHARRLLGVLYLDSRFEPAHFSDVDHELMSTIAREAAALVENAQLAVIEEQARQHVEELQIAATIQQSLMAVKIPRLPFAEIEADSIACKAVGGDFFDVLSQEDTLDMALVDVSGKGMSAAILASTLQGMLYVQLQAGQPLSAIGVAVNDYLCNKNVGKYATMLLLRLHRNGQMEYINCGHVPPRLCVDGEVKRLPNGNLPVGLIRDAQYTSELTAVEPGSRIILATDGFTEAEDAEGNFFGEERFDNASVCGDIRSMLQKMRDFCSEHPLGDDCTIVQITYRGCQLRIS